MSAKCQKRTLTDWSEVSLGSLMHGFADLHLPCKIDYDIEALPVVLS